MKVDEKVKVGIVGASGYSGEELVKILLRHPGVELAAVTSRQYEGKSIAEVFPRFSHLPGAQSLNFSGSSVEGLRGKIDIAILALPHGVAAEYAVPLLEMGIRVIDLSADFRLRSAEVYQDFYGHPHPAPELLKRAVYGLAEIYEDEIRKADLVASPGCYPTSILIPLIPLLRRRRVKLDGIVANSMSGVSGAGRKAELPYLFVECNESVRAYGVPKHRHLSEIEQELSLAARETIQIQFTPHLIPVNRGIHTTLYLEPSGNVPLKELGEVIRSDYEAIYGGRRFVRVLSGNALPDTKNVVGTNVVEIAWRVDERTGRLIVLSAEDNLVKGASGQAIQSLNLMQGIPEDTGLLF